MMIHGIVDARRQDGATPTPVGYTWLTEFAPAGLTFSEGDTRVTNTSAGDSLLHTVPGAFWLDGVGSNDAIDEWVYFEVHFTPSYSGTTRLYDGYVGFNSRTAWSNTSTDWNKYVRQFNSFWSITIQGTGLVRGGGSTFYNQSGAGFGDRAVPPIILRILWHPTDANFFFAGADGDWRNADGSSIVGNNPIGIGTPINRIQNDCWFGVMPWDEGDSFKLVSLEADFADTMPTGAVALSTITSLPRP